MDFRPVGNRHVTAGRRAISGCGQAEDRVQMDVSFVQPENALPYDAALAATFAARFAAIGEPWVTRPSPARLVAMLKEMGFSNVIHLMPSEANSRYFRNRRDDLSASLMEQMVRAVV
jgi:O-methyltransferase involved in polyketide biosynthesis